MKNEKKQKDAQIIYSRYFFINQVLFSDFPNIVADVDYCDGQPRIKDITVVALLSYIAGGMSFEELLQDFPKLTREDIQ